MDAFPSDIPSTTEFQVGYFEPPNGTKRWILECKDLTTMYTCYKADSTINLWCDRKVKTEHSDEPLPKRSGCKQQTTSEKKGGKESFTKVLTRAATSIVEALQQPKVSPVRQKHSDIDDQTSKVSPLRSTTIRRSCLDDLKKLKELLDDGVLDEEEYTDEKQRILATLKGLK